jgi:hypothetical protein
MAHSGFMRPAVVCASDPATCTPLPGWLVAVVVAAGMTAYAADWDSSPSPGERVASAQDPRRDETPRT